MKNLTIGTIGENELLELAETIKLKSKLIAERKTIAGNIKEKGRASCFISFFAHGFSRNLCEEQGDDTVGQLLQTASNNESEFILGKIYDSAISDLEAAVSKYTVEQNPLIERESVELAGSDLCRAMLGSGFEYVMCLVGDECEESASNSEVVRVVCSCGGDYFDDTTEDMWYFAIPVNNQGEPITAAEVGLGVSDG